MINYDIYDRMLEIFPQIVDLGNPQKPSSYTIDNIHIELTSREGPILHISIKQFDPNHKIKFKYRVKIDHRKKTAEVISYSDENRMYNIYLSKYIIDVEIQEKLNQIFYDWLSKRAIDLYRVAY